MTTTSERSILSHSILKTIFDSFPNPAYIWQKVGESFILVDYNSAAKNDDRIKVTHLANESSSEFFEKKPLILQKLNECVTNKQAKIKEVKVKSSSSEKFYAVNFFFIPNDLVVLYLNDITSQKIIEKDLKSSRGKYKHLFEQAPFPIVLCDDKANIIDCNYATEKIFGYKKDELIHKNYLHLPLYPSEYIPTLRKHLQKSYSGIGVEPLHLKLYKEDKTVMWITLILSKVKIKGTTLFQAILLDITELKEASQLIQHKLEIEKVISSISSRFISNNDIDDAIDRSLVEMGTLIGAKRAFLLLNNEDRTVEFYSQVSCSNTMKSDKFDFVNLNIDDFPYILREYEKNGYVYIKNVSELPQKETDTKIHLQKMQIESLLLFPIKINENLLGFIGFDDLKDSTLWSAEDFMLLKTSSEIIGNALERKWGEETLKSTNQLLTAILCSLTECIILIDREYNIIWVNNETENLFNPQFVGKKCFEFLLNSHKPCKHCIARKTFADGKIHESEYNFKAQNNSNVKCWSTTNVASNDKNGRSELVIIILRIIDE